MYEGTINYVDMLVDKKLHILFLAFYKWVKINLYY